MFSYNKVMHPSAASAIGMDLAEDITTAHFSSAEPSTTQSKTSSMDQDFYDKHVVAAQKLGVSNPEELDSERIKVDRQILLEMINAHGIVEGLSAAECFFDSVMTLTKTYIIWPREFTADVRNMMATTVRIVGTISDVERAKEYILARLEIRSTCVTRVTLRMNVSHTDHTGIIGSGGKNINSIMANTDSYVHFPQSNRWNPIKSNQVSISGFLEGVEYARTLVRLSTPLVFSFKFSVAPGRPHPNQGTPYVKNIERKFGVKVIFGREDTIVVRGTEQEAAQAQAATQMLINFSCESMASRTLVRITLEISERHHEIVKGKNNTNVLGIMERTNTTIQFPDLLNTSTFKKTAVTIRGTIDGAYKARQQLLGNLPISLIFKLPENRIDDAFEMLTSLSTKYGVTISLWHEQKQCDIPTVTIKGVEKFVGKIYEAHHEMLRLNTAIVKAEIPESYYGPRDQEVSLYYSPVLNLSLAPDSLDSMKALQPITATDDGNRARRSADSTHSSEAGSSDNDSFGASGSIGPNPFDNFEYHGPPTVSNELHTPNANWMALDNMLRQCSYTSTVSTRRYWGSAAPGAEKRFSAQW